MWQDRYNSLEQATQIWLEENDESLEVERKLYEEAQANWRKMTTLYEL